MRFRIGVHLGDVIEKPDGTVYGDGVNIAARLEGLALPGGVTVSDAVHGVVRHRVTAKFEDMGDQQVKNIADPVRGYQVFAAPDGASPGVSAWAGFIKFLASRRRWFPAAAQAAESCPASPAQPQSGGCGFGPWWATIFSITGRSRLAAMTLSSPAPQFGQVRMSISNRRLGKRAI
jgi:hypothetical protein